MIALKYMAFRCSTVAFLDYYQMSDSCLLNCVKNFAACLKNHKGLNSIYMRQMTKKDVIRLEKRHNKKHGVPGMIDSINCTHVGWKNCPTGWKGRFKGKEKSLQLLWKLLRIMTFGYGFVQSDGTAHIMTSTYGIRVPYIEH